MTGSVTLPERFRREIIDHCLAALPHEGCGMLAMDGDGVVRVYLTGNDDQSASSYTIPPQEHFDALTDAESNGWQLGGVFHSHPGGPARMSDTDLERALEPDWIYLVIDLAGTRPVITAWSGGQYVGLE